MIVAEIYAKSDVGRVRHGNEDNFLLLQIAGSDVSTNKDSSSEPTIESRRFEIDDKGIVLAVSDGMGGALAGEVASKLAVDTISDRLLDADPHKTVSPEASGNSLLERLYESILFANQLIHRQGRSDPQLNGMGATFSGLGIIKNEVDVIQVGDSRVYLVRNSRIYQLTKDQSLVQQLIDSQQITQEDSETHPLKNVILQALGAQNEIFPAPATIEPRRDDIFLLCSDGLSNKIPANDLLSIVLENREDLAKGCATLINEANHRGGEDNITVILVKLTGSDLAEPSEGDIQLQSVNFGDIHDTADQNI